MSSFRLTDKDSPGIKAEKSNLTTLGAKRHRGSGSSDFMKSDGHRGRYRIECKSTKHKSMSVKLSWLKKITREAVSAQQVPCLSLIFTEDDGTPLELGEWSMVPSTVLEALLHATDGT